MKTARPRRYETLHSTLLHEAAHSVVAHRLGIPAHRIEIDVAEGVKGVFPVGGRTATFPLRYQILELAAVHYAGYLRNRMDGVPRDIARWGASSDFRKIKALGLSPRELRKAIRMSWRIVRENDAAIRIVARALTEVWELNESELARLMRNVPILSYETRAMWRAA